MPFLMWNDRYSVGVKAFDMQHQKLVQLINALHDAMVAGKGNDVVAPILDQLVIYTKQHFQAEEKAMAAYNYPALPLHKIEHDKLTKQVQDFQAKFNSGQVRLSVQLMQFLKDWLTNHILETDKKYGPYMQN